MSTSDNGEKKQRPVKASKDNEPQLAVSVFGGHKEDVSESVREHLVKTEDATIYQTWVNIRAMKRLSFLFVGGVESAGGLFELLCVMAVIVAVLAAFVFWQVIIFLVVILVLTLLSGGAALKSLRGVFIEVPLNKVNTGGLDTFVGQQLSQGRFVKVALKPKTFTSEFGDLTRRSNKATRMFQGGISFSLVVATAFLILEAVYWYLNRVLLTDLLILGIIGVLFLVGVLIMDVGVIVRRRLSRNLGP